MIFCEAASTSFGYHSNAACRKNVESDSSLKGLLQALNADTFHKKQQLHCVDRAGVEGEHFSVSCQSPLSGTRPSFSDNGWMQELIIIKCKTKDEEKKGRKIRGKV